MKKIEFPKSPKRAAFGRIAFVLQGGGALGAYQGGVFQAMAEQGFTPDWIAGTSIGAINGAIIAGNAAGDRIARLKKFWEIISETDFWRVSQTAAAAQSARSFWSIAQSMVMGRPGFFAPRWCNPSMALPVGSAETASFYDTKPLRTTLQRLVDFDLLNEGSIRLSVGVVNILTGSLRYFDSKADRLAPDHILASGALPPGFPAVRIENELYWDGGIYSNTPLEVVLDDVPRVNTLCLMLSLFNPAGSEPKTIAEAEKRHKDIMYATRMQEHVREYRRVHNLRRALRSLYALLPESVKDNPEIRALGEQGCETTMHIVELIYPARQWESSYSDADFSRAAIQERWSLGHRDASFVLEKCPWLNPVPSHTGVAVHTIMPSADAGEVKDLAFR
ncbi:MAG: patatin-like phospholipase family protein [Desulfobacteraceae bacterium]|nr:MAG: patatin-like phospholipase family protein [Desulfobacteraceae bacterium]